MKKFYIISLILINVLHTNAQIINTIAGGYVGNGATAFAIGINPENEVIDALGNIYIANPDRHIVLKLSVNGVYSTFAGTGISGFSGDGGLATQAQLMNPYNIAIDSLSNIYVADSYDNRIRKVSAAGIITTIAGNGIHGFSGDGGTATSAELAGPNAVAADNAGNVYIADFANNRLRKVSANGIITTVAGTGNFGSGGDEGPATAAQFSYILGVAVNKAGELFISDLFNNKIRKITTDGILHTVAGNGNGGFSGDGGLATSAQLTVESSVALDSLGNFFISDVNNNRLRKVDINGVITTIAGNGTAGFNGDGTAALSAELNNPHSVAIDAQGNLYITDRYRIRKVSSNNVINTIAGDGSGGHSGDGAIATSSQLYNPRDAIFDASGNVLIADYSNQRVRKVDVNGIITTIAGNGSGSDGGPAVSASISSPTALVVNNAGNIFIASGTDFRVRKIDGNGIISTVVGNGVLGFNGDGGPATAAQGTYISAMVLDDSGNLYITDRNNWRIRKITTNGIIQTIAGNGTQGFSGDGGPAIVAELSYINALAIDKQGNLYVSDYTRIRKITPSGVISTIAGNGTLGFSGDGGNALLAMISPEGIALDATDNILIADNRYDTAHIRKINSAGIISSIAGGGTNYGDGGSIANAQLPGLASIALDAAGNILITDAINHRIRKITNSTLPLTLLHFNAKESNGNVAAIWETANEINTYQFVVERSVNGINFQDIAFVKAKGNNTGNQNYNFTDSSISHLGANNIFYRLQTIDNNGKKMYSDIIKIAFYNSLYEFVISPNPATSTVYIKGNGIRQVDILDNTGKLVLRNVSNGNEKVINISQLTEGMYVVKAYFNNGVIKTEKMFVK